MAKRSPPIPFETGSIKPRVALAAIAASTALPPRFKMSSPTCVAAGTLVQTIPCRARTSARGKGFSSDAIDLAERNPEACNHEGTNDSETERYDHVFMLALLSSRANAKDFSIVVAHTGSNKGRSTVSLSG